MKGKKKSLRKNILREISRNKSRFISMFAIIGISVGFFTGVKSACPSMIETARQYFEDQKLMDISLISTVGFDEKDVEDIKQLDFVREVMPSYFSDLIVNEGDVDTVVRVMALPDEKSQINIPLLKEGRIPQKANECMLDSYYAKLSGIKIGDTVTFSEKVENTPTTDFIKHLEYKIVGLADTPMYLMYSRGSTNVGGGSISFYMLIKPEEFVSERYTKIFILTDASTSVASTVSDEYKDIIDGEKKVFEELSKDCTARFKSTTFTDAKNELETAKKEFTEKKDEALKKIADGEKQLADGEKEFEEKIAEGEKKIADGEKELEEGRKKLEEGKAEYTAKINDGKQQLADGREKYAKGKAEYEKGLLEYNSKIEQAQSKLDSAQKEFDMQYELFYKTTKPQAESKLKLLQSGIDIAQNSIDNIKSALRQMKNIGVMGDANTLNKRLAEYEEQLADYQEQYDDSMAQLSDGEKQLNDAKQQLESAKEEFLTQKADGAKQLNDAKLQLEEAEKQLSSGELELQIGMNTGLMELQKAQTQLDEGEKELEKGKAELETQKQEALKKLQSAREELENGRKEAEKQLADGEKKLDDAQKKIDKLENAKWYVYDRDDNVGYTGLEEDAQRVDNVAKVFPLFFLIVASLVCLTTMSRMVEERRTEIGTLKALGYSNRDISAKYLIYAGTAGIGGCITGGLAGVFTLPEIIVDAYGVMYLLPKTKLVISWNSFIISSIVAVICICLVAVISCRNDLRLAPATLMRPKSPKPGKRILLEYITPLWKRLNFTSKVTARNLFRYKARFFMTVIGVAGCTALIVSGFGMMDSIRSIGDLQYVDLTKYEQIYALSEKGTPEQKKDIMEKFREDDRIGKAMLTYMGWSETTSKNSSVTIGARIIIGGDSEEFQKMFILRDRKTHELFSLEDSGVIIDERMSDVLKVKTGDMLHMKTDDESYECRVSAITENYAGNFIYMTPKCYEDLTGNKMEYNVVLATVAENAKNLQHEMANDFMKYDDVVTVSLISEQVDAIMDTLNSLNIVVFVMIFCAGLLAMVVLYNLTNINIAERVREIATIKVLGFYSFETANYIYRENIVLTVAGAFAGLFMGNMLTGFIVSSIQMNNVMFPKLIGPLSYVWGFLLTLAFSMLVNFIMYFKMNKISMVESLKSIE